MLEIFDKDTKRAMNLIFEISQGNIEAFKNNLSSMGLKPQNLLLVEFCNLLINMDTSWKELSKEFQISTQEFEVFNKVVNFMILSQYHLYYSIEQEQTLEFENIMHDLRELFKQYFVDDEKYLDNIKHKSRDEVLDKALNLVFKRLRLSKKKVNIIKAIGTLVVCTNLNISVKKMEKYPLINQRFKKVSDFLDVNEQQLELLIDIFSANPIRIFREVQSFSHRGHRTSEFERTKASKNQNMSMNIPIFEFIDTRISLLAETFHISKSNLEYFGSLWVSSYEFCFRGKNNLGDLAECLGLSTEFLNILMLKHRTHPEVQNNTISKQYHQSHVIDESILSYEISNFLLTEIKNYEMSIKNLTQDNMAKESLNDESIKRIIKLRNCNFKIFKELLEDNMLLAYFTNQIYKMIHHKAQDAHMRIVLALPTLVSSLHDNLGKMYSRNALGNTVDKAAKWSSLTEIIPSFINNEKQFLMLQIILLFTGKNLEKYFIQNNIPHSVVESHLVQLLECTDGITHSMDLENVRTQTLQNFNFLEILFKRGFFKGIMNHFLSEFFPNQKDSNRLDLLLGIMISMHTNNRSGMLKGILNCLTPLIEKTSDEFKDSHIKGAFGFITKDASFEKDMILTLKELKIKVDTTLAMNLLKVVSNKDHTDHFNPAYRICQKYCEASKTAASLLACMKGDLKSLSYIADLLKVQTHDLMVFIGCAKLRFDIITNSLDDLASSLNIKKLETVQFLLSIASGDFSSLSKLESWTNLKI